MIQPMRVLLVSVKSTRSHGGIAVWTDHYLNGCEKYGIESELVNIEMLGARATGDTSKRNILDEVTRTKGIFAQLKGLLSCKAKTFDVAHLNTSCGTFGLVRDYWIARRIHRKGIPVVTQFHRDVPAAMGNPISRFWLKKLLRVSAGLMVLCESSRQYLKTEFGVEAFKVPNFIDAALVRKAPKEIRPTAQKAVFVGRVQRAKGAAELYQAARRLPDLQFELIGAPSEELSQWETPENIHLLGGMPHEQVLEHLDEADFFIFPTYSEGFSMALMECMARGLPAVATDVGANSDMLSDGCGIIIPAKDADALVRAAEELQSVSLRQEMSAKAVQKVQSQYTVDAVMKTIKSIYEQIQR